jgi:hypothetical protein
LKHGSLFDADAWTARAFKPSQGPATPVVRLAKTDRKAPWSPNRRDKKNDQIRATFPPVTVLGCSPVVRSVIKMVADKAGVSMDDVRGRSRKLEIIAVRRVAIWVARRFTDRSLKAIASEVGWRDHTTVLDTLRQVEKGLIPECPRPAKDTPEAWAALLLAHQRDQQRQRWREYKARQTALKRVRNARRRARYQQLKEGAS